MNSNTSKKNKKWTDFKRVKKKPVKGKALLILNKFERIGLGEL